MTTTSVRRLAYRQFPTDPGGDGIERTMAAIELQLSLAADYNEPAMVRAIADMRPERAEAITSGIEHLYDLADEIESAERLLDAGDEEWAAPRAIVVAEYEAQLRTLARLVRGAS